MLSTLNFRVIGETLPAFWTGFLATLSISLAAFAGALIIGIVACAMSLQPSRFLRAPAVAYIDVVRATPLLAQLYFLYFGLPSTSSGMSYWQQMRLIILPQALRPMVSPLIGQAIVLVKDSSLLSLISVLELTRAGQTLANDRFLPVEGLLTTAVCYLIMYYGLKLTAGAWSRMSRPLASH